MQHNAPASPRPPFSSDTARKAFVTALLINLLWINASEIFRYFVLLMPMLKQTYPQIDGVADMNLWIFLIWGTWDTVLWLGICAFSWFFLERFGDSVRQAILAGTLFWMVAFLLLWVGIWNMGLSQLPILAVALPLSWLEMVVAALIMRRGWLQASS